MYFSVVWLVSVQKTHESAPYIKSSVIGLSPMIALITYNGEVPISPYTIPRVTSKPAALSFCMWEVAMKVEIMRRR
jgi:hypothetical protein